MNQHNREKINLTLPNILLSQHYYRRLWLAVRNVDIARRDWLDELADTFRDYPGVILTPCGQYYDLPFIDDIFGDDIDMRWLGYYLCADDSGSGPRVRTRQTERLQILDLYFRIKWPEIARHFAK